MLRTLQLVRSPQLDSAAQYGASVALCILLVAATSLAQTSPPPAAARALDFSRRNLDAPENRQLRQRTGTFDVTETVWAAPGAAPVITTGLEAHRQMIGPILQETLREPRDPSPEGVRRVDDLTFDNVSGQWEYVSMDTRAAVGLMPAHSWTRAGADGSIVLLHDSFAVPGPGPDVTTTLLRMQSIITVQDADHDQKNQYFVAPDGSGTVWLAHRYAYTRRR